MKRQFTLLICILLWAGCSEGSSMPAPSDPQHPGNEQTPGEEQTPSLPGALRADGTTDTYALITAAGYNYETPDASGIHAANPVRHITQIFDDRLQEQVFEFHIHAAIDDDRGLANVTDRQRNEIKTDAKSPASLVGQPGETMTFRWKFRLPAGMKTSNKFCHIHQLKGIDNAAGTADVGNPVITFTTVTQSNGKQQFQVRYIGPTPEATGNVYLGRTDLTPFLGEWVEAEERVTFGTEGSYALTIRRCSDARLLLEVAPQPLNLWRDGTTGMRPKWGIYRSIGTNGELKGELRDEILRFADFSIEKAAQ